MNAPALKYTRYPMEDKSVAATTKDCRRCLGDMVPIHNAEESRLVMWFCPQCKAQDRAIGRERLYGIEVKP